MKTANVSVWSVTIDGDNVGIETVVCASEADARAMVFEWLRDNNREIEPDTEISNEALSELWTETFDGACIIEQWKIAAAICDN
jgi:hypothetical protein